MIDELQQPEFQSLDSRHVTCERIGGIVFSGILLLSTVPLLVISKYLQWFPSYWTLVAVVSGVLLTVSIVMSLLWPPLDYRYLRWRLDDTSLQIHRGVFWRHQISVPLGRVQHADVSQGPLQRVFQLGSLTVHTAASRYPSVTLEGLNHSEALQLRDRLVQQNLDDDDV